MVAADGGVDVLHVDEGVVGVFEVVEDGDGGGGGLWGVSFLGVELGMVGIRDGAGCWRGEHEGNRAETDLAADLGKPFDNGHQSACADDGGHAVVDEEVQ